MICLSQKVIVLNNKSENIKEFLVWWQSPFGMHDTLAEAISVCTSRDLDPEITLRGRVVAIGESGGYEVLG